MKSPHNACSVRHQGNKETNTVGDLSIQTPNVVSSSSTFVPKAVPCWPTLLALPYLWSHATDGWHIITCVQEVGSVALQLEFTQPVVNGFSILSRGERQVPVKTMTREGANGFTSWRE